ncbi:MAG: hypothetical protein MHM6MM_007506 [Cercozoa sp. M6MM]
MLRLGRIVGRVQARNLSARVPSIRFRHGKRAEIEAQMGLYPMEAIKQGNDDFGDFMMQYEMPKQYQRIPMTEDEIDAILSGGSSKTWEPLSVGTIF